MHLGIGLIAVAVLDLSNTRGVCSTSNSEEMFGRGKSEGKFGRFGQTFLPFATIFACQNKKRPVAVLGETRPVYPDKGCVGEVLGSVYLLPHISQDGSMELMVANAIRH